MTDPSAGLLAAILERPEDDAPRLILADWLDDVGRGDRADFIRCQIELANWPCECDEVERVYHPECRCKEKGELQRRGRALLAANEGRWLDWLEPAWGAKWVSDRECRVEWSRGFVSSISLTLADFMQHAKALFAAAPITEVRLTCRVPRRHMNQGSMWGWYSGGVGDLGQDSDDLPRPLWDCLEGYLAEHAKSRFRWFPTEALAQGALCAAAARLGRKRAGLPPL